LVLAGCGADRGGGTTANGPTSAVEAGDPQSVAVGAIYAVGVMLRVLRSRRKGSGKSGNRLTSSI